MANHHCHAAACIANVPPEMLMCKRHWGMVPYPIQRRIWGSYRRGQCEDWEITSDYAEAAKAAVIAVAWIEGRTVEETVTAIRVYEMLDPRGRDE